jgi:hypothetical protein
MFLYPFVQYCRHCSADAVQACFVCAREQACHLVAGRTYERTTESQSAVNITFMGIKQVTLLSDFP